VSSEDQSNQRQAWLEALKSLEGEAKKDEKSMKNTALPLVDNISESLVLRGDKSAKSSPPSLNGEGTSGNTTDAKPKEVRRTLITTQEQLAEVIADLKDADLMALDLETTGLDPRKDSMRLLSLATKGATYIVDCRSVDPTELFPILAQKTLVAHNAQFDQGFLSPLGFEPGKVADTMVLSQLLYAGSKVEPLKRGQISHSLDSVVERELGLELDKTHQSGDWGGTLTPEMLEYAAMDVEILLPLYDVLKTKIEEAGLAYVAQIEHKALPAVVWMSSAGVPIDADGWREHSRKMEADAAHLENALNALAPEHPEGKVWNFGSHQQIRKVAKLLGVDLPDTKDETLALYAEEHQFITTLRNYRRAAKLASTYGAAWLENGYHEDGRIYASWRQLRAARLFGAATAWHEATGYEQGPRARSLREPYLEAARSQLDQATWEAAFAEGQAMTLEGASEYAVSGEKLATPTPAPERFSSDQRSATLTRREEEVSGLVARGLTNRQIASELSISEHTAATHIRRILKKLGLISRTELAAWVSE
jgi:DNA-binding CsgD family transcriptional regulator